jgi:hypothetical protein
MKRIVFGLLALLGLAWGFIALGEEYEREWLRP